MAELVHGGLVETRQGSGVYSIPSEKERLKIAYITFSLDTYIFPHIIRGISDELFLHNSDLLLYHTGYSIEKERSILLSLKETDGIIITPCRSPRGETNRRILEKMDQSGTPVILLDSYFDTDSFSTVAIDDKEGGETAAAELYSRGHRKITIVYGKEHQGMVKRMEGAVSYLEGKGLKREADIFSCSCSLRSPGSMAESCIDFILHTGSTAVFCTNDQLAHAVILRAEKIGLTIPETLSVIGFDNSELASVSRTPYSSIAHPKAVSGRIAVQSVINRILSPDKSAQIRTVLRPTLIRRGSVADI